ncbi:MAG: hypothetical protein ISS82_02895 [Nanoarchaeota archaeon]|nr:hypothetical protein [Nanoarchaeota archaeon]
MNKKAVLFLPVFSVLIFIVLTYMFFVFSVNEEKVKEKIGFGDLQLELFNTYFEGEKDNFYYEKFIEYSILKTSSDFKKQGGLKPDCNNILKFDTDYEPDYIDYYLELFNKNTGDLDIKEPKLEDNFIILTLNKKYQKTGEDYEFTYTKEFSFKKKISIDINALNELKNNIKTCLQDNDQSQICLDYSKKEDNILTYEIETEPNLYDDSNLIFKLDLDDTGVITSIL